MNQKFCRLTVLACIYFITLPVWAGTELRQETRVDQAQNSYSVTGDGVIIAIIDRGIDYTHPDFRNEDGSTRILYIYDLTDNSGSGDADNFAGVGTVYSRAEIDAALTAETLLATRDAVGHGTTTAGLAGGNGRASNGLYAGMAPQASYIIVKFTTSGAPAHDDEPAEAAFYNPSLFPTAVDFVLTKADEHQMPVVALANFGSIGAISDGTTQLARTIDENFGPGKSGRVFVTGASDDGGAANHASGTVAAGETIDLKIKKGRSGYLRFRLWYDDADQFSITIVTPSGSSGPFAAPTTANGRDVQQTSDFFYAHNGHLADYEAAENNMKEVLIDFSGVIGDYIVQITGTTVANGDFHAWLNPSNIFYGTANKFESYVVAGYTIWDMAAAQYNINPNSYVLRHEWTDAAGNKHSVSNQGAIGDLWLGSGVGPTTDGRYGITVSAPGERLFAPYAPRSYFATFSGNIIFDDGNGGMYGLQSAVSAAAPVTTGIIALMLDADSTLDAAEVKDILQRSARQDAFTGSVPNNNWGYGKINAYAAIEQILGPTHVADLKANVPVQTRLEANYPNPFNPETVIGYSVPEKTYVRLSVFDLKGRLIATIVDESLPAGTHKVTFDARGLPSGIYLYRLQAGEQVIEKKMTLLK